MVNRFIFALIAIFWVIMNVLLWRSEFSRSKHPGGSVPIDVRPIALAITRSTPTRLVRIDAGTNTVKSTSPLPPPRCAMRTRR